MLPVIPIVCACGFIASALGLAWYDSLSSEKQSEADQMAAKLAWDLYSTTVDNLNHDQLRIVNAAIQRHLRA